MRPTSCFARLRFKQGLQMRIESEYRESQSRITIENHVAERISVFNDTSETAFDERGFHTGNQR